MPAKPSPEDPSDPQSGDSQPLGFNLDIGDLLRGVGAASKPRRRTTTRSRTTASGSVDEAMRRAVRVELQDVERALRDLAEEVVRLRKAHEDLIDRLTRLSRR